MILSLESCEDKIVPRNSFIMQKQLGQSRSLLRLQSAKLHGYLLLINFATIVRTKCNPTLN